MTKHRKSYAAAIGLASPLALMALHPAMASASTPTTCAGRVATIVVTSTSPITVYGTTRNDVIVVKVSGHIVRAGYGNDVICGSIGRDVIWRSRAKQTPALLAKIIKSDTTKETDQPRYFRAFDFLAASPEKDAALKSILE